jgi:hypothetical protein
MDGPCRPSGRRRLPSASALTQRGAVAPPAPWLPLLLRSSLVHLFAAAVVLLLRHRGLLSRGGQNLSTLGSCTPWSDPPRDWRTVTGGSRRVGVPSELFLRLLAGRTSEKETPLLRRRDAHNQEVEGDCPDPERVHLFRSAHHQQVSLGRSACPEPGKSSGDVPTPGGSADTFTQPGNCRRPLPLRTTSTVRNGSPAAVRR